MPEQLGQCQYKYKLLWKAGVGKHGRLLHASVWGVLEASPEPVRYRTFAAVNASHTMQQSRGLSLQCGYYTSFEDTEPSEFN